MARNVINHNDRSARLVLPGRDFSPQAAGSTPHTLLTREYTYYQLILNYVRDGVQATEAQLLADVVKIQLKLNGRTFREGSAAEFMHKPKLTGNAPVKAGKLVIFLSETEMRNVAGEDVNGIGTMGDTSFSIHVTYAAGIYIPKITYTAVVSEDGRGPGDVIHQLPIPIDVAGGTSKTVHIIPTDEGDLRWLHFYDANITSLEIKHNKVTLHDGECDVSDLAEMASWYGFTMQAGVLSWSPMFTKRRVQRLPMRSGDTFTVKLKFGVATNTFNCVMETEKRITMKTPEPGNVI